MGYLMSIHRINELVEILKEAKEFYYNTDTPKFSDSEFDALEEELRELDPENNYFSDVGYTIDNSNKIIHNEPMLSMGKAKNADDVNKWFKRLNLPGIEYCLQPKIDGLSATCRYENGKLVYVATRGDGFRGQDITYVAPYIKDIKDSIIFTQNTIEIRGELYLPKDTMYDTKGKALRNNCVGLINRKENRDDIQYVRFIAYQMAGNHNILKESDKIETLKNAGFNTVDFRVYKTGEDIGQFYKKYLDVLREDWSYETDGIIITVNDNSLHSEIDSKWVVDHHHHYNLAIKPPSQGKSTKLIGIEWQVSRQGSIIPVAQFEPIEIGGATLERASLHNCDNVLKLKLSKGDTLFVERANDVIPYVRDNISKNEKAEDYISDLIPGKCPSCNSPLKQTGVNLKCENINCDEIKIQQIIYWVKESEVEGVAEGTLRSLYLSGLIRDIKDLYTLKYEDLMSLEGFADKKVNIFLSGIEASKKMSATKLLSRLGILLVQEKSLNKLNIKSIEDFINFNDSQYKIGQNIIKWKNDALNLKFLNDLIECIEIIDDNPVQSKGKICMTGKGPLTRKELIRVIEERGWEFSPDITKDVDILLCEDPEAGSSKLIKAKKLGIKLLSYSSFV